MSEWTPPVDTRWWLEGHADEALLTRVVETGARGTPACPIPPPREHSFAWLSRYGVAVSTTYGGAVAWVEAMTKMRPRTKPKTKSKRKPKSQQGRLL